MASPHYRYKNGTLTFTPTGGSAQAIAGVLSIGFNQGGSVVDLASDASDIIEEMPLTGIKGSVSIGLLDNGVVEDVDLGHGVLTFTLERVKGGRGAVAAADIVVTAANAVLTTIDSGGDSVPGAQAALGFDIGDNGSGALFAFS